MCRITDYGQIHLNNINYEMVEEICNQIDQNSDLPDDEFKEIVKEKVREYIVPNTVENIKNDTIETTTLSVRTDTIPIQVEVEIATDTIRN